MNANALRLRGRMIACHQIPITSLDSATFQQQLLNTLAKAPALFQQAPCVLDLSAIESTPSDDSIAAIIGVCRSQQLIPFALTGNKARHKSCAEASQLAWVDFKAGSEKTIKPSDSPLTTKVITTPVRSGQQIYARNEHLLITSQVSAGAEVAADGNIHILGALRGRAIAGASGNPYAEIICQQMQAELISIAGLYRVQDDFPDGEGSARCWLSDDQLNIDYL